jgi:hypothetical protein
VAYTDRDAAEDKLISQLGGTIVGADNTLRRQMEYDLDIQTITFKVSPAARSDVLVIVKGIWEGQKVVAFHNAPTFWEATKGVLDRIKNRSLKFKEDTPYEG